MNFFKKIHELFRQKELIVKKSQKHDANLQKNSTLYFQVGLIICLLATNALFEMYFETTIPDDPIVYQIPEDATEKPMYHYREVVQLDRLQLYLHHQNHLLKRLFITMRWIKFQFFPDVKA